MLRSLFPRLTAGRDRGRILFESVVNAARQPHWYVEGGVPDTIDGRFAILATLTALTIVRLDQGGRDAQAESVAVTERFIATLDVELRQLGVSDPAIGKQVRSLVRSLERRVGLWRDAVESRSDWNAAAISSVFRDELPEPAAAGHITKELQTIWAGLCNAADDALIEGKME